MKKALFLDRDGIINLEKDYLYKIEDFEFLEGIFDLCLYFQERDYMIILVTNQSGIARGFYTQEAFLELTSWMKKQFLVQGIIIQDVYFCPHHPDISGECDCRKPKAGMLLEAGKKYTIDLKNSVMIGDKERDIEAGLNAGVTETYLLNEKGDVKYSKATEIVDKLEKIWINRC